MKGIFKILFTSGCRTLCSEESKIK